jgi:lactoylglutathione lyase
MKFRFAYTGLRVTDLERAVRFYTEGLGLKELKRGKMEHGGIFVELVDEQSRQQLELNWYPPDSTFNTPYDAGEGLDHLGFEVEDADEAYSYLIEKFGASPAIRPWKEGNWLIGFVKDPDGIWIELVSRCD